jgi:hypothetical protein
MGCRNRVPCSNLYRRLEMLPFVYQYILLLTLFAVKNKNYFTLKLENYTKSKRQFKNLYQPITNFTIHQRGVHYMAIKIFNNLPSYITDTSTNAWKFEIFLKQFLHIHSFYTVEGYFQYNSITSRKRLSLSLIKKFYIVYVNVILMRKVAVCIIYAVARCLYLTCLHIC